MKFFLFLLICFSLASLSLQQKLLSGVWTITPNSYCPYRTPNLFRNLKVNETNTTNHDVNLGFFLDNGTEITGSCRAIESVISCGVLTTTLQCSASDKLFLGMVNTTVILTWNSYSNLDFSMSYPYNSTVGLINNCTYSGSKSKTTFMNEGSWQVVNCTCNTSCCYAAGSTFKIQQVGEYRNYPYANITGTLQGDFCNNTLRGQDQCYQTSFTPTVNDSLISMTCGQMGKCGVSPQVVYVKEWAVVLWDQCIMVATNSGERMRIMMSVVVVGVLLHLLH